MNLQNVHMECFKRNKRQWHYVWIYNQDRNRSIEFAFNSDGNIAAIAEYKSRMELEHPADTPSYEFYHCTEERTE